MFFSFTTGENKTFLHFDLLFFPSAVRILVINESIGYIGLWSIKCLLCNNYASGIIRNKKKMFNCCNASLEYYLLEFGLVEGFFLLDFALVSLVKCES